jgi:hypothetical protein
MNILIHPNKGDSYMKLYHRLMSQLYGALSSSLEDDYVHTEQGQTVYLKYWSRYMYHRDRAKA